MRRSLTRHLLAWALGALFLVWGSFIALGYNTGQDESDELTDGHLASVTALLLSYRAGEFEPGPPHLPAGMKPGMKKHDYQQSMSVVVWDAAGAVLTHTGDAPRPAFDLAEGFANLSLGSPAEPWRAFSRWDETRSRKVMVLLSERERDALAEDIATQIAEPGLWLLPVVALALGLAIRRGLRPLYRLSREVHALDIEHAGSLEERSRHEELRDTVIAINTLKERYHAALTRERALANEFAHEMRTPLAAVSLHASALKRAPAGRDRDEIVERLERDVLRAGQVLSDLLALARASRAEWDEAAESLDLSAVAQRVVADFAPLAHESGHELWLVTSGPYRVMGHRLLLELALRNLVENAVSHTRAGTRIEVQLNPEAGWVQVCDDGMVAEAGPASSSQPRLRSLGLGLGHRVVEKIAAIHGARFEPLRTDTLSCYRLSFPSGTAAEAQGK